MNCGIICVMIADPVRRLFWDMDADALDVAKHRRAIISRVLNYGTLADWQWIENQYGRNAIRAEVTGTIRSGIRERSRRLAELLFG